MSCPLFVFRLFFVFVVSLVSLAIYTPVYEDPGKRNLGFVTFSGQTESVPFR